MDTKKLLDTLGIVPVRSLNYEELGILSKEFAESMLYTFENLQLNYAEICRKIFNCKMYIARFDAKLGNANYIHKDGSIYIREGVNLTCQDGYILHEFIHYFQDIRESKGTLKKIGICDFEEFKVKGLALNEAAVQYVVAKMLDIDEEEINCYGIEIKTKSKDYYPLLCDLIEKIIYFIGEESLIDSVLFSTNQFRQQLTDYLGEDIYNSIQHNFDLILDIKQKMRRRAKQHKICRKNKKYI